MLNTFQKYKDENVEEEVEEAEDYGEGWWYEKYIFWIVLGAIVFLIHFPMTASSSDDDGEPVRKRKRRKKVKKKRVIPNVPVKETDVFDRREALHRTKYSFDLLVARIRIWGSVCIVSIIMLYVPALNYYIPPVIQRLVFIIDLVIVLILFIEFSITRQYRRVPRKRDISVAQKEKASLLGFSVEEMTFGEDKKKGNDSFYRGSEKLWEQSRSEGGLGSSDDDVPPKPVYLSSGQPQTYHEYWADKYRQSNHSRRGDGYNDDEDDIDLGGDAPEAEFLNESGLEDDSLRGLLLSDEDPYDFITHGKKREDLSSRGGSRFIGRKNNTRNSRRGSQSSHSQSSHNIGPGQDNFSSYDLLLQDQIPLGSGYMREIEEVNELEHLTSRMNEFKKIYNPQGDQNSGTRSSSYRRPTRTDRQHPRFPSNQNTQQRNYRKSYVVRDPTSESDEQQDRNEHMKTLQKFGLSPFMMSIWMKNMRGWISRKIIQPINYYVQQSDKKFRLKGLKNYDCGHDLSSPPGPYHRIPAGLRKSERLAYDIKRNPLTLRYILMYLQRDRTLTSIILDRRRLESYLELSFCFATRPYLVRRLRELASSYAAFKWDGGSNKNWTRALATDAELMMQFVVNFFNQIIPSSDKLMGKTMFSQNHFVDRTRGGDDNKHISKNGLYISMEKKDPPHFAVIWEGRVLKTEKGKNNIFFTLCLFSYILKTKYDSNLGRAPGSKKYVGPGSQYNLMECLT